MSKKRNDKGQFTFGNEEGGRFRMWETEEDLQKDVDDYFKWCDENPIGKQEVSMKTAVTIEIKRPYTVEGLALHLGVTRQTLWNYQKNPKYSRFFDILTQAKEKIVRSHIEGGMAGVYNPVLTKFLLTNNAQYREKVETATDGELTVKIVRE